MANLNTPYGFKVIGYLDGQAPTFAPYQARIQSTYATPIFKGDPVTINAAGYLVKATPGTQVSGIFDGCEYLSKAAGNRPQWMPYWPGNGDAINDAAALIINSPSALFEVQTGDGGPVTGAAVGNNISWADAGGNTFNGISGVYADFATIGNSAALPFRVVNYAGNGGYVTGAGFPQLAGNGSDGTTQYNTIIVAFNAQDFKVLTGV